MIETTIVCARCTITNHPSNRFCDRCGLPLGTASPDAGAGLDPLGPYEPPDPSDLDTRPLLHDLVSDCGFEAAPAGHGWRVIVPVRLDRQQAVYLGQGGTDTEGRPLLSIVSVCGPANVRDARILLNWNARTVEGHFAIKVLRGEEYFVVVHNFPAETAPALDPAGLIRRVAEVADGLEDRLSRGRDIY